MKGLIKAAVLVLAAAALATTTKAQPKPTVSFDDLTDTLTGTESGFLPDGSAVFVDTSSGSSEVLNFAKLADGTPLWAKWNTGDTKTLTEAKAQIYFSEGPLVAGAQISDVLEIHFKEVDGVGYMWGVLKSDKSSPPDPSNYGFITQGEIDAGAALAETGTFLDVTHNVSINLEPIQSGGTGAFGIPAGFGSVKVASDVESVPDGGNTLVLLGTALSSVGLIRRKLFKASTN